MRNTFAATLLLSAFAAVPASAQEYIALGDSITFGETDLRYVPSDGNRGYVADFASTIAARTGTAPDVVNLAIDGETASSFFTGFGRTPPVQGRGDLDLALQNIHYSGPSPLSQSATFLADAAAAKAAGRTIDTVSISLGFNELAALTTLPTQVGLASIPSVLEQYQVQYGAVLSEIRSVAPSADLYVLNYFNPFPGDNNATPNPASPIFAAGGPLLNADIKALAAQYGAIYVDTFTPFVGREAALTYIGQFGNGDTTPAPYSRDDAGLAPIGDVHPNAAGYAVIADQLAAASSSAVPEPSAWMVLLVGMGAVGYALRRRRTCSETPTRVTT